jgi:hypothetical protein
MKCARSVTFALIALLAVLPIPTFSGVPDQGLEDAGGPYKRLLLW